MKYLKIFEEFDLGITVDDIIDIIKNGGSIYADTIIDYPKNDPEAPLYPISIDDDGEIVVRIDDEEYTTRIKYITRIEKEKL